MSRKRVKNVKKLRFKRFLILAVGILIIYIMVHPINLLKNNFMKPASVAADSGNVVSNDRNYQKTTGTKIYKDYNVSDTSAVRKRIIV